MGRGSKQQQSFAAQGGFEKYGRKSRRELFLDEMEQVVPWSALESLVGPHYAKAGNGRRPEPVTELGFKQGWMRRCPRGSEGIFLL